MLLQRCLDEFDVLVQVSRLSADPFQHNRRLSETLFLDLNSQALPTASSSSSGGNGQELKGCRSETHSIDQAPNFDDHYASSNSTQGHDHDNPFQNDQLPLWQKNKNSSVSQATVTSRYSNASSPENNNYDGQQMAYGYKSLNETPTSPELANHRAGLMAGSAESPPGTPEVIQAGLSDVERQRIQQKIDAEITEKREERLTVLKKASLDRADEDHQFELESSVMTVDAELSTNRSVSARNLKKADESSDEEDDNEDIIDDDINRSENFKSLQGTVIEIDLKRNDFGFGLALAGHSNRNRMGTFICGIHPQGAAFEDGQLQVGDELLKVKSFPFVISAKEKLQRRGSFFCRFTKLWYEDGVI